MRITHLITLLILFYLFIFSKSITISFLQNMRRRNNQINNQTNSSDLLQTCDNLTPDVGVGDVFAVYSHHLLNIFQNSKNSLRLVRYERKQQNENFVNKLIYQVTDSQSQANLYFGASIVSNSEGMVQMSNFVDSLNLQMVLETLNFQDDRLYNYPCGEINQLAVNGFERLANAIAKCDGSGSHNHQSQNYHNGHNYQQNQSTSSDFDFSDHGLDQLDQYSSYGNGGNQYDNHQGFDSSDSSDLFSDPDSPFRSVNLRIRGQDSHGNQFVLGSKKPKSNFFKPFR